MARKRYLKKTPLAEARESFLEAVAETRLEDETVEVGQALHRITAEPVFARISSPHYHGSAMDGICVRAEDTFGATEFSPRRLRLLADEAHVEGCFAYLDTGQPLPAWADAVIMIEKVRDVGKGAVSIDEAATPWQNVRLVGEDVVATELLLPRNHRLRPYDLGAVLAAGHTTVLVKARPRVAIIPTGDEITAPGEAAGPGEIIDFNSTVLAAMVAECGGTAETLAAVPDDPALLERALADAVEDHHLVALIAGSSAGEHDYTAEVIDGAGRLLVHGIEVMPGKPAVLGVVGGKPVIGIPGYPVSAIVIAREVLQPALQAMLGAGAGSPARIRAVAPRKIPSRLGLEEFVRVTLGRVQDRLMAVPLARGAGVISTMVRADGFLRIPGMVEGINAGEEIEVEILRSPEEIEHTVLCTGSHDLSISVLEDQLKRRDPRLKIATANVGSLGGLHSVRRGETHMAGTHLLDPATGAYNIPDIEAGPPGRTGGARALRPADSGPAGAPGQSRQTVGHRRSGAPGSPVRQPPARFRHPGAAGLPARSARHRSSRRHTRLRPRRVHPHGRCRGGGQRTGGYRPGDPLRRRCPWAGLHPGRRRAIRPAADAVLLRVAHRRDAAGSSPLGGIQARDAIPRRLRYRRHRRDPLRAGIVCVL